MRAHGSTALIGAIVAGGASTRFAGEPKGLELVGSRRIIDRVADALAEVATELLIVSNAPDAEHWLPQARSVCDLHPARGSLVGLHAALAQANAAVFAIAWDMPFVTRELVALMARRAARSKFATVPMGVSGPEPFCAIYTPACLPFLESAIGAGDLRVSALLARLPHVDYLGPDDIRVAGDPTRLFFNVNDAEDLAVANRLAATH